MRKPKYWWVAEYKCGCSADSHRKADLLNYCAKHGMDRFRLTRHLAKLMGRAQRKGHNE